MSQAQKEPKTVARANQTAKKTPGGVIASGVVNLANPVLKSDDVREPRLVRKSYKREGEYVRFFDSSDSLLSLLESLVINSPTLRSIIRQKLAMLTGEGFLVYEGKKYSSIAGITKKNNAVTDEKKLIEIDTAISTVNAFGESLSEVKAKAILDFLVYGNCFIGLSRNKEKVFAFNYPFYKGRLQINTETNEPTHVGFTDNWEVYTESTTKKVPLFPVWEKDEQGIERTVIHIKDFNPGFDFYGVPEYISAREYAGIEYRIPRYNSSKFENGYTPSAVVQFFGAYSKKVAEDTIVKFQKTFTGTGNNNKIFAQVLSDEKLKAHVQLLKDESDGNFMTLANLAAQAIVTACRWTMSLAGFATGGKLGTNEQIRRELEMVQSTVINPIQDIFLQKFVSVFVSETARINKSFENIYFGVSNTMPVSFAGELDINDVLTLDEKREMLGYGPASPEQQKELNGNSNSNFNPAAGGN